MARSSVHCRPQSRNPHWPCFSNGHGRRSVQSSALSQVPDKQSLPSSFVSLSVDHRFPLRTQKFLIFTSMSRATTLKQKDIILKVLINAFPCATISNDFLNKCIDNTLSIKGSKDATALSWHKIGNHILIKSNSHKASNIRVKRPDLKQRWKLKFSPALCIQAEGSPFPLTFAKIIAPVEFCIVPRLPPDVYIFKFVARRSARAVTFPLPVLIFTAHSQFSSPACLWLLNTANFMASIRKLTPQEQCHSTKHSGSGTEPALKHNFANPLGFQGWRDVTQSPFTHAFWLLKIFLPASQLISEIDLEKHISVWTLVPEKGQGHDLAWLHISGPENSSTWGRGASFCGQGSQEWQLMLITSLFSMQMSAIQPGSFEPCTHAGSSFSSLHGVNSY